MHIRTDTQGQKVEDKVPPAAAILSAPERSVCPDGNTFPGLDWRVCRERKSQFPLQITNTQPSPRGLPLLPLYPLRTLLPRVPTRITSVLAWLQALLPIPALSEP